MLDKSFSHYHTTRNI